MSTLTVSAPAKLIISGEHAVVYGYPTLATAIDLRMTVTYKVSPCRPGSETVHSVIPIGGLGSSSALSVCRAVCQLHRQGSRLTRKAIAATALGLDREFHSHPSGVDTSICTYGGWLRFQKDQPLKRFRPIWAAPTLFLLNSGRPVESTATMVALVADLRRRHPRTVERLFRQIEDLTNDLQGPSLKWSGLIRQNENLLEQLGVVSLSTARLIRRLEKVGAAAKITGAGGLKSGSGMVIVYHPDSEKLLDFAEKQKLKLLPVKLGQPGVRYLLT